jgi:hypothetical protein
MEDDGKCFVTKSSLSATVVFVLGIGETPPPYIVFAPGNTYHPAWAPHFLLDLRDKDGEYMAWRYASNENNVLMRRLMLTTRGPCCIEHGFMICDGVGTHIGFIVLEIAIELGLEVMLRVPPLSFRLQGEDTVDLSVLKVKSSPHHIAHMFLLYCDSMHFVNMLFHSSRRLNGGSQARDASGIQYHRKRQHALISSISKV